MKKNKLKWYIANEKHYKIKEGMDFIKIKQDDKISSSNYIF